MAVGRFTTEDVVAVGVGSAVGVAVLGLVILAIVLLVRRHRARQSPPPKPVAMNDSSRHYAHFSLSEVAGAGVEVEPIDFRTTDPQ